MRISSPLISIVLLLAMSCLNEDAKPDCDGSLEIALESKADLTTCATLNGSITVSASGGTGPYQYSLNGGPKQLSPIFSGLSAGDYSVTVFDANKCEDEIANIELVSDSDLDLDFSSMPDNSCDTNNGSISLSGVGGAGSYQYKLNSGPYSSTSLYSNLAPGTYSVSVKDADNCEKTISVSVLRGSTNTSWQDQVKAILADKCVRCHPGAGTSDDWSNHGEVFAKRSKIRTRITATSSQMPPAEEPQLTVGEKALIVCWIDDGAPNN